MLAGTFVRDLGNGEEMAVPNAEKDAGVNVSSVRVVGC
jgi:hypothetical protein